MPLLRHVITYRGTLDGAQCLPDIDATVLENLQTLSEVSNLKFGERVLKRIPNIKTLKLYYGDTSKEEDDYGLNKLCCLHKLASLRLRCSEQHTRVIREVSFPHSLKKLTLVNTKLPWEDIKLKIGSLPLLQVLKLERKSFTGSKWETFENQFSTLKFLLIESCDLEYWITHNTHFPRLEHLVLRYIKFLREIPSSIGCLPTLQSIKVKRCGDSVVDSAQRIKEEQEEFGNDGLQIYTCSYQDFLQVRTSLV
ncbi:hypothetical protein SASPL_131162 [Salvia splendens]|uniref:Disease resistance protein RPM1 n=1 Tax=Salvia splendens TaxID=180675 RepID=A0A8X8X8R1_SALSN|nr:hypothetical protein SASPL_131162 [Salvia splendens]